MKAIILAAGRGSRMNEGTANNPKCMMLLHGKTLLDYCMDSLLKAGFKYQDIGIVTGYRHEKITVYDGVRYFHNDNWETTNMFVSLTMAREWLLHEPCIVCYSDIVFHENAITRLIEDNHELSITYYAEFWDLWQKRFENPFEDLETFRLNGDYLTEIGLMATTINDIEGQYMGLLRFEPSGWAKVEQAVNLPMPKSINKLDMTSLLQHLIIQGHKIHAIRTSELWLECDNLNDIAIYENELYKTEHMKILNRPS